MSENRTPTAISRKFHDPSTSSSPLSKPWHHEFVCARWDGRRRSILQPSRAHLAIFTKMDRRLSKAVRLARSIDAIHVGRVFLSTSKGIQDRGQHEKEIDPSSTTNGKTAVSPMPRICHLSPYRASVPSSDQRRRPNPTKITTVKNRMPNKHGSTHSGPSHAPSLTGSPPANRGAAGYRSS